MTESSSRLLYLVAQAPEPGYEAVFQHWYDNEHIPELLACPGFESAERFELVESRGEAPQFIAIYSVRDEEAFHSEEYLRQSTRRPEDMTPAAREVLSHRVVRFTGKYRPITG